MTSKQIMFCGDPHGRFDHIVKFAEQTGAATLVLLGDMEPARPLHDELAPIIQRGTPVYWIAGNHDADSDQVWIHVWDSQLAAQNIHARVVELADGTRLAGLGGVFRKMVWYPGLSAACGSEPAFWTREQHAKATPRQDRWRGRGTHRKHWSTIYPSELEGLANQQADILVSHEALGYHPRGFQVLDDLARQMGVEVAVHGHQHDSRDSSARWAEQRFRSFGVGLRGLSLLDTSSMAWTVVQPGELDAARPHRIEGHQ